MEKVLITGADGFIGRHLMYKMLDEGKMVYAIIYPGNDFDVTEHSGKLILKRLDLNQVMDYVDEFPDDIDTMYHFAWTGVQPELRDELDVQMANIDMTMACMKFAVLKGIKKVIMPGSTNEYLYYGKPINKDAIPSPSNAYGATKVALRYLCHNFALKNNIEFIYAIITGIYAADRKDNNVIFYTIDKLLQGEKPLLTKLEQLWDYIYIDDVADALFLIGEKGKAGAVYGIGHGDNWPLSNYIRIIHRLIDQSLPLGIGEIPYTTASLPSSCIDLSELKKDTDFRPKVDFEDGIVQVIKRIKADLEKRNE